MKWFCFLFWFYYRLFLATLAHTNWALAIYVNCAYFVLWKSYDLVWFWMHLILCACFVPLRSENYLLVWCNLVHKRFTVYPNRSYKEIYVMEYGKKRGATKSERDLYELEKADALDKEVADLSSVDEEHENSLKTDEQGCGTDSPGQTSVTDLSTGIGSSSEGDKKGDSHYDKRRTSAGVVAGEEERDCMEQLYIGHAFDPSGGLHRYGDAYSDFGSKAYEDSTKLLNSMSRNEKCITKSEVSTQTSESRNQPEKVEGGHWSDNKDSVEEQKKTSTGDNSDDEETSPGKRLKNGIRDILPKVFQRKTDTVPSTSTSSPEITVLKSDFTNVCDLLTEKQMALREKRERRELLKRVRERRRVQLLALARREAKTRVVSSSVELLLQLLRMVSSFALLVGNIRKTFLPASIRYVKPDEIEHPIMHYFRWTVYLDVLLFWSSVVWAYCLQWHLCCRLGLFKFWLWTITLVAIGAFFMVFPMSYVQRNLDSSWCRFLPNSTLASYQPDW